MVKEEDEGRSDERAWRIVIGKKKKRMWPFLIVVDAPFAAARQV